MDIKSFFKKKEFFFGLDIGASSMKCVELDMAGARPVVTRCRQTPVTPDIFMSYSIQNGEKAGDSIMTLLDGFDFENKRAVVSIPGPSVFTKRIAIPKVPLSELADTIQFEAGNFIPHNINAVHLDYHVFGETDKNQLDVLVVAVKNEVIESVIDAAGFAGVSVGIADVDLFALQNVFEFNYPELVGKNIALVNIGSRYTGVNMCRGGESLFTGDIAVGGRAATEMIMQALGLSFDEAEAAKISGENSDVNEMLPEVVEYTATELNRQLSFFWNATGSDESIDALFLSGGGSLLTGLQEALQEKTGIECHVLNPFNGIDSALDEQIESPEQYAVAVGLSMRQFGDKIQPVLE